ncbi:MAG TPA: replication protein [Armatimonadota bacterium]|nr:replication protein [Armatimonadota bacterium]
MKRLSPRDPRAEGNTPDYHRGYLRVPLALWAALYCRAPLTRRQLQLVSVVLRESWGWRQKDGGVRLWTRSLTPRQFSQATGLSTDHLTRDLNELIRRGVLQREGRRYQLVPHPELWITGRLQTTPPQKERPAPPFPRSRAAETTLTPPVLKKGKIRDKNVGLQIESGFSTVGDNSLAAPRASAGDFSFAPSAFPLAPSLGASRALPLADRLMAVVTAFVGPLSPVEINGLRRWIGTVGVGAVWRVLEPGFRRGRQPARRRLENLLEGWC